MDFSIKQESVNVSIKGSHLARDAWILATYFTNVNGKIAVASRKGCVDFSISRFCSLNKKTGCRIPHGMRGFKPNI